MTFSGFRSRCRTPRLWAYATVWHNDRKIWSRRNCSTSRGLFAGSARWYSSMTFCKSAAVDKLHHVKRQAVVAETQLVDRHDARVFELAGDLRFDLEAVDLVRPPAQDTFHGHRPADQGVLGQPDLAHASPGVRSLQKVTTTIRRGRVRPAVAHATRHDGARTDRRLQCVCISDLDTRRNTRSFRQAEIPCGFERLCRCTA